MVRQAETVFLIPAVVNIIYSIHTRLILPYFSSGQTIQKRVVFKTLPRVGTPGNDVLRTI